MVSVENKQKALQLYSKSITDLQLFNNSKNKEKRTIFLFKIGGGKLAKCPNCGAEVAMPSKEWDVSPKLHVKQYECCGKKFRTYGK